MAIECKWSADEFDAGSLLAFRRQYAEGENYVVARDVDRDYTRSFQGVSVRFVALSSLIKALS